MKYDPLGAFLGEQSADELILTQDQLTALVGELPDEAHTAQFWANTQPHHSSRRGQWLNAGYRAYYLPLSRSVRFERIEDAPVERSGKAWTEDELRTCVSIYKRTCDLRAQGLPINKAEWRREALRTGLRGRTEGSFEYRMQNISAVLNDLGLPFLAGYLPAKNIGRAKLTIIALVNEYWDRDQTTEQPTDDPDQLALRVQAARQKLKKRANRGAPLGNSKPKKRTHTQSAFDRLAEVVAWVLELANGRCEGCDSDAPFVTADGEPFLEVHHVRQLADGGPDQIDNAVALCPNCHRRLHYSRERQQFRNRLIKKILRIIDHPMRPVDTV
jgi:5-methylcytosine-specific restriction protein A